MPPPPLLASPRALAVAPFHVMRILEQAQGLERAGRDVIHMEVGEPDFPTPAPVLAAAQLALATQPMRYTAAVGLPALRAAVAAYYRQRYGIELDPARVILTPGGSGALQLVLAALVAEGDQVLVSDPGYPCNRHLVGLAGGQVLPLPVFAEDGYQPSLETAGAVWGKRVRALMLTTPGNPTGAVLSAARLAGLHRLTRERGAALIIDETYQGLTYEAEDHTALACGEDGVFVINSFSKYFGMTGWRLGWVVAPAAFTGVLERIAQNLFLAAATLSQHAALAALDPATRPLLDQRRDLLRARRDVLLELLVAAGFDVPVRPTGAFYVYARLPAGLGDAETFAAALLEQQGVALTPGIDFGGDANLHMLRLAYTLDVARLREAMARVAAFVAAF